MMLVFMSGILSKFFFNFIFYLIFCTIIFIFFLFLLFFFFISVPQSAEIYLHYSVISTSFQVCNS